MEDEDIGFELVAASLRADASDIDAFLPALAAKLSGALPEQTSVHHHGGLLSRKKAIQAIEVDLGEERFRIEEAHGRLEAQRQKSVRGIVLKSEPLPVEQWIEILSGRLTEMAAASETARFAVKRMLEGS